MSKIIRGKKLKKRLPLEAVLKLRSHPIGTRKGKKGYERKRVKEQSRKKMKEEYCDRNH
jgi:hypothetical protein